MDEHDIEWRCGCGQTNIDYDEKCRGCGQERYPDDDQEPEPAQPTPVAPKEIDLMKALIASLKKEAAK